MDSFLYMDRFKDGQFSIHGQFESWTVSHIWTGLKMDIFPYMDRFKDGQFPIHEQF
jgi:hypothetical protein